MCTLSQFLSRWIRIGEGAGTKRKSDARAAGTDDDHGYNVRVEVHSIELPEDRGAQLSARPVKRVPTIAAGLLLAAVLVSGCAEEPAPPPPPVNGPLNATVASFRVTTGPGGTETVQRIAFSDNLIRLPDEAEMWRLFDMTTSTVTIVDEVGRKVEQRTFDEVLSEVRAAARRDDPIPVASIQPTGSVEQIAGFAAEQFMLTIGQGYERELWISQRTLFHSDLFLLLLGTDAVPPENMPSLRRMIRLLDQTDGYPVVDRSRMKLDEETYTVERVLIAVADQPVPRSWFELPPWAAVTESPAGRRPAASLPAGQNTPEAGSRPSGSDRTDP
ncbi:MAG: hypothetical protein KY432_02730 [Acidobacteria bacterium]|nr:hypothetical protein [Acidobacteriota bacterium]